MQKAENMGFFIFILFTTPAGSEGAGASFPEYFQSYIIFFLSCMYNSRKNSMNLDN